MPLLDQEVLYHPLDLDPLILLVVLYLLSHHYIPVALADQLSLQVL